MFQERTAFEPSPVVLVVENDVLKRSARAAALRRGGIEVFEAANATEAMIVLEKIVVDVLLSDLTLHEGATLAQWVRERQLPVRVFWTAASERQQPPRHLPS